MSDVVTTSEKEVQSTPSPVEQMKAQWLAKNPGRKLPESLGVQEAPRESIAETSTTEEEVVEAVAEDQESVEETSDTESQEVVAENEDEDPFGVSLADEEIEEDFAEEKPIKNPHARLRRLEKERDRYREEAEAYRRAVAEREALLYQMQGQHPEEPVVDPDVLENELDPVGSTAKVLKEVQALRSKLEQKDAETQQQRVAREAHEYQLWKQQEVVRFASKNPEVYKAALQHWDKLAEQNVQVMYPGISREQVQQVKSQWFNEILDVAVAQKQNPGEFFYKQVKVFGFDPKSVATKKTSPPPKKDAKEIIAQKREVAKRSISTAGTESGGRAGTPKIAVKPEGVQRDADGRVLRNIPSLGKIPVGRTGKLPSMAELLPTKVISS